MRLAEPRVPPLPRDELSSTSRGWFDRIEALGGMTGNIHATFARNHELFDAWMPFAVHVMSGNSLPARHRQLVILRIAWQRGTEYQWGHHARIGRLVGNITNEELRRITEGPGAGWPDFEASLLRATDELARDAFLSNETWRELSDEYSVEQLIDLIFTVGQYGLVAMALNSLGVQRETGIEGFPASTDDG